MSQFQGFSGSFGVSAVGNNQAPGTANSSDRGAMVAFDDPRVKVIFGISVAWIDQTVAASIKPFNKGRVMIVSEYLTPQDNLTIDPLALIPGKIVSTLQQRGDGQILMDTTIAAGAGPFFNLPIAQPFEYTQARLTILASPALFTDTTSGYFVQPTLTVWGRFKESLANAYGNIWYPLGNPNPALAKE